MRQQHFARTSSVQHLLLLTSAPQSDSVLVDLRGLLSEDDDDGHVDEIDDEEAYMKWIIEGVPDEPNEDDFKFIAENEEIYQDCVKLFKEIINEYL